MCLFKQKKPEGEQASDCNQCPVSNRLLDVTLYVTQWQRRMYINQQILVVQHCNTCST